MLLHIEQCHPNNSDVIPTETVMKFINSAQDNPQFEDRQTDADNADVQSNHSANATDPPSLVSSTTSKPESKPKAIPTNSLPPNPGNASSKHPGKRILLGALGVGTLFLTIVSTRWLHYAATHQETDDAYVMGHIHPINSRIAGTVARILVDDNQRVSQGEVLVELDPRDFEIALQQAQADLENAQRQADVAKVNIGVTATNAQGQTTVAQGNIDAAEASIATSEAALTEAQVGVPAAKASLAQVNANLFKAFLDYKRYTQLSQDGAVAQQQVDTAKANYEALLAQRDAAQEQIRTAQAKVTEAQKRLDNAKAKLASTQGTLQQAQSTTRQTEANKGQYQVALASVTKAVASVKNAQLQLSYTQITAPTAGKIGNKTVEVGQRIQAGQALMSVVQEQPWIVANFKETQLGKMQPGQEVEINLDFLPQHPFKGKVDSLSPASGAQFALLSSDNATGNFTKIVQRVPIKINFDSQSIRGYESHIAPGMSAVIKVNTP